MAELSNSSASRGKPMGTARHASTCPKVAFAAATASAGTTEIARFLVFAKGSSGTAGTSDAGSDRAAEFRPGAPNSSGWAY